VKKELIFLVIFSIFMIPTPSGAIDGEIFEGPYSFRPGTKLFYSCSEKLDFAGGTAGSNEQLIIWTMIINPDLTYRLVLEHHSENYRKDAEGNRTDYPEQTTWLYCDIDEKGHFKNNYYLGGLALENLYPVDLFVELPEDENTARSGWDHIDKTYGDISHYKWNPDESSISNIVIDFNIETLLDPIYLLDTKGELHYDPEYGLPILKKVEQTRGYGKYEGKTTIEIKLDSITNLVPEEFMNFENSLYTHLEAASTYQAIMEKVAKEPDRINALFIQAKEILDQASPQITDTIIKKEFDLIAAGYEDDTLDVRIRAGRFAGIIDQPATAWKTKDLSGKTHTLKKYKGKVLLLDFWYRGCPWCMRSIPTLLQIYEKYKKNPVILLGMNVDKDENDARFVVEEMQIKYKNLLARDIVKEYNISGYPTLLIIDQNGIIRDMHIGWSEDLFERISESIDKLLK